eukprot:5229304-Pyramimonas_sp.AAC.1
MGTTTAGVGYPRQGADSGVLQRIEGIFAGRARQGVDDHLATVRQWQYVRAEQRAHVAAHADGHG